MHIVSCHILLGRWPSNPKKQTRPDSSRPVMTDPKTDEDNPVLAKYVNNDSCVAGHPTLYPCLPCTAVAVPVPGSVPVTSGGHPYQEISSHQLLSPVHAAAQLQPTSVQPVRGIVAGTTD